MRGTVMSASPQDVDDLPVLADARNMQVFNVGGRDHLDGREILIYVEKNDLMAGRVFLPDAPSRSVDHVLGSDGVEEGRSVGAQFHRAFGHVRVQARSHPFRVTLEPGT